MKTCYNNWDFDPNTGRVFQATVLHMNITDRKLTDAIVRAGYSPLSDGSYKRDDAFITATLRISEESDYYWGLNLVFQGEVYCAVTERGNYQRLSWAVKALSIRAIHARKALADLTRIFGVNEFSVVSVGLRNGDGITQFRIDDILMSAVLHRSAVVNIHSQQAPDAARAAMVKYAVSVPSLKGRKMIAEQWGHFARRHAPYAAKVTAADDPGHVNFTRGERVYEVNPLASGLAFSHLDERGRGVWSVPARLPGDGDVAAMSASF